MGVSDRASTRVKTDRQTMLGRRKSPKRGVREAVFNEIAQQQPDFVAHKITYCLRKMGTLDVVGKHRRSWLYALVGI